MRCINLTEGVERFNTITQKKNNGIEKPLAVQIF